LKRITAFIVSCLICSSVFSQHTEYEIKAAMLEKFTRLITWPDSSDVNDKSKNFIIGIYGNNPFDEILDNLYSNQRIKGKRVKIIYISDVDDISGCNMLFISPASKSTLSKILEITRELPILTIADSKNYAKKGVIINFYLREGQVCFEINKIAAEKVEIKIDYKLLKLARIIN